MLIGKLFPKFLNINDDKNPAKAEEKPKQAVIDTEKEVCSKAASDYAQTMFIAGQNIDLSDLDAEAAEFEEDPEDREERVRDLAALVLMKVCPNNHYGDYSEEITMRELAEKEVRSIVATGAKVEKIADYWQTAHEAQGRLKEIASNDPKFFDEKTVTLAYEYLEELTKLLHAEL